MFSSAPIKGRAQCYATLALHSNIHEYLESLCLYVLLSVCAESCLAHKIFLVWHWLTICGTWVYHHKTMCDVHSWSRVYVDLWPRGQIYRYFTCFRVRPISFYWFDIDLPYLAHGCISIHERMCRVRSWSRRISLVAQKYVDALPCFSNDIHATISINCKSISFLFECNIAILCKTSLSVEMHCSVYFRETRFC